MAMGKCKGEEQRGMRVTMSERPRLVCNPFYEKLDGLLAEYGVDEIVEAQCQSFYAEMMGRAVRYRDNLHRTAANGLIRHHLQSRSLS